jgi:CMP-N-acetylneuraminic acid synthetase
VAYTIEAGLSARLLADVVVSTEDEEIATVCRERGAQVPFLRPAELATDRAPSLPVVQHAVREMEGRAGRPYDVVVMLQPTTPLRQAADIDAGIELLIRTGADSVVSVVDVGGVHPFRMKRVVDDNRLINYIDQGFEDMRPRQELPAVYIRSGALYIARRDIVMEQNSFVGRDCRAYIMDEERAVNIDTPNELVLAEYLIGKAGER